MIISSLQHLLLCMIIIHCPLMLGTQLDMTMLCLSICPVLFLLPALTVGAEHVRGSVGGTVLLPCIYPVTGGTTSMCWGRGHCPTSKCLNPILRTDSDGKEVIWHQSERYRLLGNIEQGDVSLTITQLTISDSGTYCCRVEIPGWFNDQKGEIQVSVDEEQTNLSSPAIPTRTSQASEAVSNSSASTAASSSDHMNTVSAQLPDVSSPSRENIGPNYPQPIIVCVVLLLLLLGLAGFLYKYKYYEKLKTKVLSSTVPVSKGDLESRPPQAVDNIYMVDVVYATPIKKH
uniref:Ig-like domain-containing protein n=1 Tax=Xenopus tropicalis TaxID=8364 RepID=A0A6I8PP81_XENTR